MPTAYSHLAGEDVDTASEAWRHETECRWLLTAKPTRTEKHMHLYGVPNRDQLMEYDPKAGARRLAGDHAKRWTAANPLMKWRGLEAADRILADAKRLHELSQPTPEGANNPEGTTP
jgi:hypothetical protein